MTEPIVAYDLFCGVGGLTHGLRRAGIDVRGGVDVDPNCRFAYETNNAATFIERDIRSLKPDDLAFGPGLSLLASCAPCQPFSKYSNTGRGRTDADQWSLLREFGRLVSNRQPTFVTMENVPQLQDHAVLREFVGHLRGYHVWWDVVHTSTYGVAQTRKRLVLLASLLGPIELLKPTQAMITTVRQAIGRLRPLGAGGSRPSRSAARCRRPVGHQPQAHPRLATGRYVAGLACQSACGVSSSCHRKQLPICVWSHGVGSTSAYDDHTVLRLWQRKVWTSRARPGHLPARSGGAAGISTGLSVHRQRGGGEFREAWQADWQRGAGSAW
jgi:site-specific DNA-cytosine methylase